MDGVRRSIVSKDFTEEYAEDREYCDGTKFIWDERYLLYFRKVLNRKILLLYTLLFLFPVKNTVNIKGDFVNKA